jgi:hypothetical protein
MTSTIVLPIDLAPPQECPFCQTAVIIHGAFPTCPNYYCSKDRQSRARV